MKLYQSYNFKDKDPIIDILRTALKDDGIDYDELPEFSGVSLHTYYGWFDGETRRPSFACILATVRVLPTTTQKLIFKRLVVEGIRSWHSMLKAAA